MDDDPPAYLRNIWYFALSTAALKPGRTLARTLLGEPILFGRGSDGTAFALRDICPHRAIPLSYGRFDGKEIECCYHGWRFDGTGACTLIPSLTGEENIASEKIKVRNYRLQESQGCIWIFMPDPAQPMPDLPDPPSLPDVPHDTRPLVVTAMTFPSFIDHAVVGLLDPAHGPFVHKSWWWRSPKSIHAKSKAFGPSQLGFTMLRHAPSKNSAVYKLLGGKPATEITFRLPGIRIEHIRAGAHHVVNLTCVTPIGPQQTGITNVIYTDLAWARPLRPIIRQFARRFLGQDRRVVKMQQEGLRHESNLLLIRDADVQARWYFQLKAEYGRAQAENRTFANPVRPRTLHWRT